MAQTPFDAQIIQKMNACTQARFPICLNRSMLRLFGAEGKKSLDSIVMNEAFEGLDVSSHKDVWNIYDLYIDQVTNLFGENVAGLFEYESMKEMETMFCTKCPLYESVARKRN